MKSYYMKDTFRNISRNITFLSVLALILIATSFGLENLEIEAASSLKSSNIDKEKSETRRIAKDGISVEFSISPLHDEDGDKSTEIMQGEDMLVRFKITNTMTGAALTGLHPAGWMDVKRGAQAIEARVCEKKIKSFMQGSLSARPLIDLNTYYVLALNHDSSISVIDPLVSFGGVKLLTMIQLESSGADWVLSRDKKKLFVTMPSINKVAVINTTTWKVVVNLDVGYNPTRLAFQPDAKYLWIGNDPNGQSEAGGVTIIDAVTLSIVKNIQTGKGHHEIAFTDDSRFAFVTNKIDGRLSVIDIGKLTKIKDLEIGSLPTSMAFSTRNQALYVVNEGDGKIVVLDGLSHNILTEIEDKPGLTKLRLTPDGRWGFVLNSNEDNLLILDLSTNSILKKAKVGKGPDQISFTETFAYIRSIGTENISMIRLDSLDKKGPLSIFSFQGGVNPPGQSSNIGIADAIVPTPERDAVLVANPSDKTIHYYKEGMNALMGSFQNEGREPKGILLINRSLNETIPGVYSTIVKLPKSGTYDVAFFLDAPRIIHCFNVIVKPNPSLKVKGKRPVFQIEPLFKDRKIQIGEDIDLQFRFIDPITNLPKKDIKNLRLLTFLSPGIWQKRDWVKSISEGIYQISLNLPKTGIYYLFFETPSIKIRFKKFPFMILKGVDKKGVTSH